NSSCVDLTLLLISSPDEDEVFEFPSVSPSGSDLETKSITLVTGSAQRISVRFQRATTSQATQTDPLWPDNTWSESGSGSHTFPKMRCRPHRKSSKNKGFARWENETSVHERRESHKQLEDEGRNRVSPLQLQYGQDAKVTRVLVLFRDLCSDLRSIN
ncbi:ras guanyl-releasing protein 3, partial [Tachysurus ichikawai]